MYSNIQLKLTKDGSHTLYVPDLDEHYHSVNGAINESIHVFINAGFSTHPGNHIKILEVGFGTGLNTLLTMIRAREEERSVEYHTIEKYPLAGDILNLLNYSGLLDDINNRWFWSIHQSPWNERKEIQPGFSLLKLHTDLSTVHYPDTYDVIYFDAFAPDKQPEMWSLDNFEKIYQAMNPGGILTTYSSKGLIRRNLINLGFIVEKLPGPPGKKEMLRCWKK